MSTEDKPDSLSDPKIIVDEGWKSQVEREQEAWRNSPSGDLPVKNASNSRIGDQPPLPPVSFGLLVSTFATQALTCLGILPDPATGNSTINRPLAKHFIDLLAILEEKTAGNLTEIEANQIRDGLHQLRMIFVAIPKTTVVPPITPPISKIVLP